MDLLFYEGLEKNPVEKQLRKTERFLAEADFHSAEVKKITGTPYYRAKLDDANRLLFKFVRYNHKTCILLLEIILHHEYHKSRFLRGVQVDETKFGVPVIPGEIPPGDPGRLNSVSETHIRDFPLFLWLPLSGWFERVLPNFPFTHDPVVCYAEVTEYLQSGAWSAYTFAGSAGTQP